MFCKVIWSSPRTLWTCFTCDVSSELKRRGPKTNFQNWINTIGAVNFSCPRAPISNNVELRILYHNSSSGRTITKSHWPKSKTLSLITWTLPSQASWLLRFEHIEKHRVRARKVYTLESSSRGYLIVHLGGEIGCGQYSCLRLRLVGWTFGLAFKVPHDDNYLHKVNYRSRSNSRFCRLVNSFCQQYSNNGLSRWLLKPIYFLHEFHVNPI